MHEKYFKYTLQRLALSTCHLIVFQPQESKEESKCTHPHRLRSFKTSTAEKLGPQGNGDQSAAERDPLETPG